MTCIGNGFNNEDATDFVRDTIRVFYTKAASEDSFVWSIDAQQCRGKRGKKGKAKKDWHKG